MSKHFLRLGLLIAIVLLSVVPGTAQEPITVKLQTFFGDCSAEFEGITDPAQTTSECGVMRVLINKFNAENSAVQIDNIVTEWPGLTQLNAALAAGDPPDLVIMNSPNLYDYVLRGLLTPVGEGLVAQGVDVNGFVPAAAEFVTFQDRMFAMPFSIYGNMWHLNRAVWEQVGAVAADGTISLPSNGDEFFALGDQVRESLTLPFMDIQTNGLNGTTWPFYALVSQQGGSIVDAEGKPTVNTPEGLRAVEYLTRLLNEGYATSGLGYGEAQEQFLNGQSASFLSGSWSTGYYVQQVASGEAALTDYVAVPFPQIFDRAATWGAYNVFVVPHGVNPGISAERLDAIIQVLAFFHQHEADWARTGNVPVTLNVLNSEAYAETPQHAGFAAFAEQMTPYPGGINWLPAFESIMNEEIQAVFINSKTAEQALADAQQRLDEFVAFSPF